MRHLLIISFSFWVFHLNAQDTIRVPADYPTIQLALNAATNDDYVIVDPGIYNTTLGWPEVYGIKLIGKKGSDSTIIDGGALGRVITKETILDDWGSLIQGFKIQNGRATGAGGGGLYIHKKGTDLVDLKFVNNYCDGRDGGGAFLYLWSGNITDCEFYNNEVNAIQSGNGGGLMCTGVGPITISNCTFKGNKAVGENSSGGGGARISNGSNPISIRNCRFENNRVPHQIWSRGGGLFLIADDAKIENCHFNNNIVSTSATNSQGGGLHYDGRRLEIEYSFINNNIGANGAGLFLNGIDGGRTTIKHSRIDSNKSGSAIHLFTRNRGYFLTLDECIASNNKKEALFVESASISVARAYLAIINSTIAYNKDGLSLENQKLELTNSIFWNPDGYEILHNDVDDRLRARHSMVREGIDGDFIIQLDPMFNNEKELKPSINSDVCGGAVPHLSNESDFFGISRPMPLNTLPDIGAVEVKQSLSSSVITRFFLDQNEDGQWNSDESALNIGTVFYGDISYNNFRTEGLLFEAPEGLFALTYDSNYHQDWQLTTAGVFEKLYVDSILSVDTFDIGLVFDCPGSQLQTYAISEPTRCNELIECSAGLVNTCATIIDELFWIKIDSRFQQITFAIDPDTFLSDNYFGFNIGQLVPSETWKVDFTMSTPGMPDTSNGSEAYEIETWIEGNKIASYASYRSPLDCSYEPNDKLGISSRPDDLALLNEPLIFTIRFQNTENDFARDVVIFDDIDPWLDLRTMKVIQTSHPQHLLVETERFGSYQTVSFIFENIFLLDSRTNFEESNGYVTYSIEPFEGTPTNTIVNNTALILFDSNLPILTNTTSTILVDEFPVGVSNIVSNLDIEVFPNPGRNVVMLGEVVEVLYVFSSLGKLIYTGSNVQEVDLSSVETGLYYFVFQLDGQFDAKKWLRIE